MNEELYSKANLWIKTNVNKELEKWIQTPRGQRWDRKCDSRKGSPYHAGFKLPDGVDTLIEAMDRGDEEAMDILIQGKASA